MTGGGRISEYRRYYIQNNCQITQDKSEYVMEEPEKDAW